MKKLQIVIATQDDSGTVEFLYGDSFKETYFSKSKGCKKDWYCICPNIDGSGNVWKLCFDWSLI